MNRMRSLALVLAFSPMLAPRAFADDPVPTITPFAFMIQSGTYTNQSPTTVNNTGGYSAIVGWTAQDPDTLAFTGAASPDIVMSNNSGWGGDMWVYNGSNVTLTGGDNTVSPAISGGTISRYLIALNTSTINLSDQGSAKVIELHDNSQLIMNGGTIGVPNNQTGYSYLGLWDSGAAHLSAGTIYGGVSASGSTTVIVSGTGIYGDIISDGVGSSVMMTSGFVSGGLAVDDGAVGGFQGGTVGGLDTGGGNASLTMTTGACNGTLYNGGAATMTMNGGTGLGINVEGSGGVTTLAGGTINGDVGAANGGTLYLNSGAVNGNISVGSGGTVILNGIAITGNASLTSGTLTLNSGSIGGNLIVNGGTLNWNSSVSVAGSLLLQGYTTMNLSRNFSGSVGLSNNAYFEIDAGASVGAVTTQDNSQIGMYGGQAASITTYSQSYATIQDPAVITGDLTSHDYSEPYIEGGTIDGKIAAYDFSSVYFYGGTIHGLEAHNNAYIQWNGGQLVGASSVYLNDESFLDFYGINLSSSLISNAGGYSVYALSGYYPSGAPLPALQLFVQNGTVTYPNGAGFALEGSDQQWNLTTGGSWATAVNWAAHVVPNSVGAVVDFYDATTVENPGDLHIALNGNYTLGTLNISTANNISIDPGTGGTLTFDNGGNGATISVSGGQHQINVPVVAHDNLSIYVYGNEDDDIRPTPSPAFHSNNEFAFPTLTLNDGITIASGKTLTAYGYGLIFTPFIRGGGVDLESGTMQILFNGTSTGTSRVEGLSISPYGAVLDLTNNDLILDYTAGNSPLESIQEYLASGFEGGYWEGAGIISSTAGANPAFSTALGYADNSVLGLKTFDGQSVDSNVILIKYTWVGDANLDGIVDAADLAMIAPAGTTWATGDFNYDGVVNADDFALFQLGAAESAGANISTTLPEPGIAFGAIALCGSWLSHRRFRGARIRG